MTITGTRKSMFDLLELIKINQIDLDGTEIRDCAKEMKNEYSDFNVGNYRFIHQNSIDEILVEELKSDPYILGCFTAKTIAKATNWPQKLIETAQETEDFEVIGNEILAKHFVRRLANIYSSIDGYGHHFASYDHEEHKCGNYYAFKIDS